CIVHFITTYSHFDCLFSFSRYVAHRDLHSFPTRRSSDLKPADRRSRGRGRWFSCALPKLYSELSDQAHARTGAASLSAVHGREYRSQPGAVRRFCQRGTPHLSRPASEAAEATLSGVVYPDLLHLV